MIRRSQTQSAYESRRLRTRDIVNVSQALDGGRSTETGAPRLSAHEGAGEPGKQVTGSLAKDVAQSRDILVAPNAQQCGKQLHIVAIRVVQNRLRFPICRNQKK